MSVCPRVTGYNRMSRKLRLQLISESHFSSCLAAKMNMFSNNFLLSSHHLFCIPATPRHFQVSFHCSDVSDVQPVYLPFFPFPLPLWVTPLT